MAIHVALNHKTHYRYDRQVILGPQVVRLRPAPHCRTPILSYSLKVQPERTTSSTGNRTRKATIWRDLSFRSRSTELFVEVDLVAEMAVFNPFDFFLELTPKSIRFPTKPRLLTNCGPYLETEPAGPKLSAFLRGSADREYPHH